MHMAEPSLAANILLLATCSAMREQLSALIRAEGFPSCAQAGTIEEAKRILIEEDMDLVLIDTPLGKEDAVSFAIDLIRNRSMSFGVITLIAPELTQHNLYQAERIGIVTLKKPLDGHLLLQTMRLLLSFQARIKKLESQADKLQQKLEDDRLVSRAKLLLIENMKMREQDAHHYLERKAMDACVRKTKIAKDIIRKYGPK